MFNNSVDKIMKVFNKAIEDLEVLEEARLDQIDRNASVIQQLSKDTQLCEVEANRARSIRTKLQDLFSI